MTEPPAGAFRYRAFISYSHADAAWAAWLHKAVERYRVPRALVGTTTAMGPVPARLAPLFRDREELAASTDLSGVITTALAASSHLAVLCSPRAARSKWVNAEILAFKRLGREDRIVAIIVDGVPNSGDPATECFPEALRFRLGPDGDLSAAPAEPVAADARDTGDGRDNAKLKLIAGLLGVGLDALKRREAQAQRRRTLFAYGLTGVFALLAVAAAFFALSAERQRAVAEANLKSALENASTLTFDIARKSRDAEGVRKSLMIEILKPTVRLLDGLAANQTPPPEVRLTQATALNELARASIQVGFSQDGLEACRRAIEISAAAGSDGEMSGALANERVLALTLRGDALALRGRLADAGAAYLEADALASTLAAGHGGDPEFARNLFIANISGGEVKRASGEFVSALLAARRTLDLVAAFERRRPGDAAALEALAGAHLLRGRVSIGMGRLDDADAALATATEKARAWIAAAPGQVFPRLQLAQTLMERASVMLATGRMADSLAQTREAVDLMDALWRADPADILVRHALFVALFGEATVHLNAGRFDEVEPLVVRAEAVVAGRSDADADGPFNLTDRAEALALRGALQLARRETVPARDTMREAVATARRAFALDGENFTAREELARLLGFQGIAEQRGGDARAALTAHEESLGHYVALSQLKPFDAQLKAQIGQAWLQIAQAKSALGDRDGARAAYQAGRAVFAELAAADPDNRTYPSLIANIDTLLANLP